MHRRRIRPTAVLLACAACAAAPGSAIPGAVDVSGDDCTISALVYDRPPPGAGGAQPGTAFINDGCAGDRIFLGIRGERRELTRADDGPLGTGGAYSDGKYRVLVRRGRLVRAAVADVADEACYEPDEREVYTAYEAEVRVWSGRRSWRIDGALRQTECLPPNRVPTPSAREEREPAGSPS